MQQDNTIDPRDVLKKAKVILLVDWPNPTVPKKLLEAGFLVFCYSPNGYTKAEIVAEYPHDVNQKNIFPPANKQEGFLVFRPMAGPPSIIDIANVFRPEQDHARIITNVLLGLGAKCIWLQPPITSAKTRDLAERHGLTFIEGHDVAQIAAQS
jgi:predicted CoA-binding protein